MRILRRMQNVLYWAIVYNCSSQNGATFDLRNFDFKRLKTMSSYGDIAGKFLDIDFGLV